MQIHRISQTNKNVESNQQQSPPKQNNTTPKRCIKRSIQQRATHQQQQKTTNNNNKTTTKKQKHKRNTRTHVNKQTSTTNVYNTIRIDKKKIKQTQYPQQNTQKQSSKREFKNIPKETTSILLTRKAKETHHNKTTPIKNGGEQHN